MDLELKDKVAIVTGGTGLYFKVLVDGLAEIPGVPKIDYSNLNSIGTVSYTHLTLPTKA